MALAWTKSDYAVVTSGDTPAPGPRPAPPLRPGVFVRMRNIFHEPSAGSGMLPLAFNMNDADPGLAANGERKWPIRGCL
jgi:hypothetical protein